MPIYDYACQECGKGYESPHSVFYEPEASRFVCWICADSVLRAVDAEDEPVSFLPIAEPIPVPAPSLAAIRFAISRGVNRVSPASVY